MQVNVSLALFLCVCMFVRVWALMCVLHECVCVGVCAWERERERTRVGPVMYVQTSLQISSHWQMDIELSERKRKKNELYLVFVTSGALESQAHQLFKPHHPNHLFWLSIMRLMMPQWLRFHASVNHHWGASCDDDILIWVNPHNSEFLYLSKLVCWSSL